MQIWDFKALFCHKETAQYFEPFLYDYTCDIRDQLIIINLPGGRWYFNGMRKGNNRKESKHFMCFCAEQKYNIPFSLIIIADSLRS